MKIENFEIFPFSMSIPEIFHLKSCIYRSTKHTGQHLFLVDPFQHSNLRSLLEMFKKICKKLWKLKNFGIFVNFGVKLRLFHSKTETISSLKTTGQQTATLVNVFIIPIYGVCRNRDRNCIKTLKIGKFWVFVTFGFNLRPFSLRKKKIIFSEKPTGQLIRATLTVFNILINEVLSKFDKNWIKSLKIGKFLEFWSFIGSIFSDKTAFISS